MVLLLVGCVCRFGMLVGGKLLNAGSMQKRQQIIGG